VESCWFLQSGISSSLICGLPYCASGSLAIECITEEFVRQQSDIAEVQSFLSLPQHRPLKEQLHEAGELISGGYCALFGVAS
jgi:hypothetical protein